MEYDDNYYDYNDDGDEEQKIQEDFFSEFSKYLLKLQYIENILIEPSKIYLCYRDDIFTSQILDDIKKISKDEQLSTGRALWLYDKTNYKMQNIQSVLNDYSHIIYPDQIPVKKINECILCCQDKDLYSQDCGHQFCKNCYKSYIKEIIQSGSQCIFKTCPMDKCPEILNIQTFEIMLSKQSFKQYKKFIMDNCISKCQWIEVCPGKDCPLIIKLNDYKHSIQSFYDAQINVICDCGFTFCSLCKNDGHRPITCKNLESWNNLLGGKNSDMIDEAWIKMNTKKCPKCKIDIEKNQGCMHMTCKQCSHQFCWLCMGDWKQHQCNQFAEQERIKSTESAKLQLEKFNFYTERYTEHKKSTYLCQKNKQKIINEYQDQIKNLRNVNLIDLKFLIDALNVVCNCRRAIAYSYATGYYLSEEKRGFYEFQQGEVEKNLEILDSKIINNKPERFFNMYNNDTNLNVNEFTKFSSEIQNLSHTLINYFNNMINSFENGLPEMQLHPQLIKQSSINQSNQQIDSQKKKQEIIKDKGSKQVTKPKKNTKTQKSKVEIVEQEENEWECNYCGNKNPDEFITCQHCFIDKVPIKKK